MQANIIKCEGLLAGRLAWNFTVRWTKSGPLSTYHERLKNHEITHDDHQLKVVKKLQNIYDNIIEHNEKSSSVMRFFKSEKAPKGLYIHGAVGGGKTMLLDLFYETIDIKDKRRTHFHEFMLSVHKRIHSLKKEEMQYQVNKPNLAFDPIPKVAKHMANECWLVCLDEFQVTDIADAMILKRLFSTLFQCGVVLLATSNRDPDSLYKHGLQRSHFLPFIKILKDHCDVLELNSGIDYRIKGADSSFFFIKSQESDAKLANFFKLLCSKENDTVRSRVLTIQNRSVTLETACGRVAYCTFNELCNRPLGSADYLLMSQVFHTIFIRDVPKFTVSMKSAIRRFITLIDTLYDNNVRVVVSAEVPLLQLFDSKAQGELSDEQRMLMDDLQLSGDESKTALFSGEEELFAFDRTLSRLHQMQTEEYWKRWEHLA